MITKTTFIKGRMNKSVDERMLPQGEYVDALNIRSGSTEDTEIGAVENTKGNELLVSLEYNGEPLVNAVCIGAYEDGARETIYWFVTSSTVDMIVSYNTNTQSERYHVVSETVLNFDKNHLVNSVDMIDDLLFFTDNHNPPRKININRPYPTPFSGVDRITEDDLSVIVKPPLTPPTVSTSEISSKGNYLEDKFITFAYRWRYLDGEYSALSPFSDASFMPDTFGIDVVEYSNSGMRNTHNVANVGFNSGDERVTEIQLCFKRSDSNTVYVIDNFKKQGKIPSNTTHTTFFDNSKIYTVLPQEELFRLYDNVPRFAQAQTVMGNRLMYGNYVDGYNMEITEGGQSLNVDYDVELVSNNVFDYEIDSTIYSPVFSIDPAYPNHFPLNSGVRFDFNNFLSEEGKGLSKGSIVRIGFLVSHEGYTTSGTEPTDNQAPFNLNVSFELSKDYLSLGDLVSSEDMAKAIGTDSTIKAIADSDDGGTLTDLFNSSLSTSALPNGYTLEGTGSSAVGQALDFFMFGSNQMALTLNAAKYTHATDPDIYEYFTLTYADMSVRSPGGFESLHSNRNYAIGIVYSDEYGRQSTVFTDKNNSVFVDSSLMTEQNKIKATINSPAPYWASNYRMAIKPTYGGYDTIYSAVAFEDNGFVYMLLNGENSRKIEEGDTLIVKMDSRGSTNDLIETTVLEVKAQERNFLEPNNTNILIKQPAGVYLKLKNTNFSVNTDTENTNFASSDMQIAPANISRRLNGDFEDRGVGITGVYEKSNGGSTDYEAVSIPIGSHVRIRIKLGWTARGCEAVLDRVYIAERDWDNLYDMYVGQNLNFADDLQYVNEAGEFKCFYNTFVSDTLQTYDSTAIGGSFKPFKPDGEIKNINESDDCTNYIDFLKDTGTGKFYIRAVSGSARCTLGGYNSAFLNQASVYVGIIKSSGLYIFETKPSSIDNDIYYLSNEVYGITDGYHEGGTQNQTASQPAISTLNFFDSYCFGNGAESYKIEDKLAGDVLLIGQQTSAVSEQDYKEAHRFASITYSGVYNAETNLNKLNQFNLALANYKDLEQSFGEIGVLHARETDLLVLQEDKISYVLQGKNLLSDSVGGGSIVSIPEVLGTQIARQEESGISLDPSSFAHYDSNVFFTDAKRGDVLMLLGGSYKSDKLAKISDLGMRSYFRDTFIEDFGTLKLGAYDPYMDEFVLSFNDETPDTEIVFPPPPEERYDVECDSSLSRTDLVTSDTYNVTFEPVIGTVDIDYAIDDGQEAVMTVLWDDSTVINSIVSGTGTESFNKTKTYPNTAIVNIACQGLGVQPCDSGMDVVFLIDYTGSMGPHIDIVKDQINNIVNTIVDESGGDYRLSLVTFDEGLSPLPIFNTEYPYSSLPESQKYIQSTHSLKKQYITAFEKFSSKNADTFKASLNQLNLDNLTGTTSDAATNKLISSNFLPEQYVGARVYNTTNGTSAVIISRESSGEYTLDSDIFALGDEYSMGLRLGNGDGSPEPSDIGLSRIVEHNISGAFRSGVNKMVILYTDAPPGGDSDTYTEADADEMRRLASICNANGIVVSVIGAITQGLDTFNAYQDTADITGGVKTNNFNSTAVQEAIQNICE